MNTKNKYDISIIIVTYNSKWEKLRTTIASILLQKDINIEIIVSDDGSKNNLFKQQEDFFLQQDFNNYKLLFSDKNQGTVKNFLKGVENARGKYIKGISPGDLLYDEFTLKNWFCFMEKNKALASFGDYISYAEENNILKILKIEHHPKYMKPYLSNEYNISKEQLLYVFFGDNAVGATFLTERMITKRYLNYICNNIKFAEDYIYHHMIIDDILIHYYSKNVIWYEYGIGISTSKNVFWNKVLLKDRLSFYHLVYKQLLNKQKNIVLNQYIKLIKYNMNNSVKGRFSKVIYKLWKLYNILQIPKGVCFYIKIKFFKSYTSINANETFYRKCQKYK